MLPIFYDFCLRTAAALPVTRSSLPAGAQFITGPSKILSPKQAILPVPSSLAMNPIVPPLPANGVHSMTLRCAATANQPNVGADAPA